MKLIDKSALVAEIEKIKSGLSPNFYEYDYDAAKVELLEKIEKFIDTIEIKEVDLEEEIRKWQQKHFEGIGYVLEGSGGWIGRTSLLDIAEHFFELGLKT